MASKQTKKAAGGRHEIRPLSRSGEKKLAEVVGQIADEEQRKWAEIYGRKVLKLQAGLRSSTPPIPPKLGEETRSFVEDALGWHRRERGKVEPPAEAPAA